MMLFLFTILYRDPFHWVAVALGSMDTVCSSSLSSLLFFSTLLICCCSACNTNVTVSMSFGGQLWPISPLDFNNGPTSQGSSLCVGGIFDLSLAENYTSSDPAWVIGDTFLVRILLRLYLYHSYSSFIFLLLLFYIEKCVYGSS